MAGADDAAKFDIRARQVAPARYPQHAACFGTTRSPSACSPRAACDASARVMNQGTPGGMGRLVLALSVLTTSWGFMRTTRIMLIGQLSAAIMLAAVLFYRLACPAPPYHPARASVVTLAYLIVSLGASVLVYRARSARQRSSGLSGGYPLAADGLAPLLRDPRIVVRAARLGLVAVFAVSGLVLLAGFSHGLGLREDTAPVPGWPQTSATVTRVYSQLHCGSCTYTPVATFRVRGHTVYFTAPESADAVKVGDQIRVTYEPGNPYLLHDLSAGQGIWKYPLYTSLSAIAFVLLALVAGLTLTDQKRIQFASDDVPKVRRSHDASEPAGAADGTAARHLNGAASSGETRHATFLANRVQDGRAFGGRVTVTGRRIAFVPVALRTGAVYARQVPQRS
jgi:hypothetical protein